MARTKKSSEKGKSDLAESQPKRRYVRRLNADGSEMTDAQRADHHREYMRQAMAARVAARNEIGELPAVVNPERRESCRFDLLKFGETYLATMFENLEFAWASFHFDMVATLQRTFLEGGLFAEALPRGSAKTSWLEAALIWAGLYGHCRYAVLIDASKELALEGLESIKTQFETQDRLREDFPAVCVPIDLIDRKPARCNGQRFNGEPTRIKWSKNHFVLPTIPGSEASGFRVGCSGITGSGIRGLVFSDGTGRKVRPDVVALNDFQTDKSVMSVKQTQTRLNIIRGAICGLGGPGKQISVVAACTVLQPKDGADQLLEWPDWQGMRHGLLDPGLPERMDLWKQYRGIQKDSLLKRQGTRAECDFYAAHRDEMDKGTVATWPDRYNRKKELSGIQAAMNIFFREGEKAFWAEFMNRPECAVIAGALKQLDTKDVQQRFNGSPRYAVPLNFDTLTVGADVQKNTLFYWVTAWRDKDFTGAVIDYGFVPAQERRYFQNLDDLVVTLQSESGAEDADIDAAVTWGLNQLGQTVLDREYLREDGIPLTVKRVHIDINWQPSEAAVARFCRLSKWKQICYPARGQAVTSTKRRISAWQDRPGEQHPPKAIRRQCEWMVTSPKKHLICEVYHWKAHWQTRMNTALSLPLQTPGSISFYGSATDVPWDEHLMAAEHLTAHFPVEQKIGSEEFIGWTPRIGAGRHDFLDCLINSAVAASVEKIELREESAALAPSKPKPKTRKPVEAQYF